MAAAAKRARDESELDVAHAGSNVPDPAYDARDIENMYQRLSLHDKILIRPNTYVGSMEVTDMYQWVVSPPPLVTDASDSSRWTPRIQLKSVQVVPGLYKIFDEILVNVGDAAKHHPSLTRLNVTIDDKTGRIVVENNGPGIPVHMHSKENLWIPEMVFTVLLTGQNYGDDGKEDGKGGGNDESKKPERITGGQNGYGAKLTNIFSEEFIVEVADAHKTFYQKCTNNMKQVSPAVVKDRKPSKKPKDGYVRITFVPDYEKFGLKGLDADHMAWMCRRVVDFAGTMALYRSTMKLPDGKSAKPVHVSWNNRTIDVHTFLEYCKCFEFRETLVPSNRANAVDAARSAAPASSDGEAKGSVPTSDENEQNSEWNEWLYEQPHARWQIVIGPNPAVLRAAARKQIGAVPMHMSFINDICTWEGGTHIDVFMKPIVQHIQDHMAKKYKDVAHALTPAMVKNELFIFINGIVSRPKFGSQTKDRLDSKPKTWGNPVYEVGPSDKFLAKLVKTSCIDRLEVRLGKKADSDWKKSDRAKRFDASNYPKLLDAPYASVIGKSSQCSLILTEGDSAKALAVSGLSGLTEEERKYYGVMVLKGVPPNVLTKSREDIDKNEEFSAIIDIMGLRKSCTYESADDYRRLRYGQVILMTDQDLDGAHIKGLVMNMFACFWPKLVTRKNFISEFVTPIIKATLAKTVHSFFSIPEYRAWHSRLEPKQARSVKIKYYKGLGTSTSAEGRAYFADLEKHRIFLVYSDEDDRDRQSLQLAFGKQNVEARKAWINTYQPDTFLNRSNRMYIRYHEFFDREYIQYMIKSLERSIPSGIDGLKPGQRAPIASMRMHPVQELKVSSAASRTVEDTNYHHGETSLQNTIIGEAQDFGGSNNVPLLYPSGQFGTIRECGKDHASPRYIFTSIHPLTKYLLRPEDDPVLTYRSEDGQLARYGDKGCNVPDHYVPIIPGALINGPAGIGGGWSSTIPAYDPRVTAEYVKSRMRAVCDGGSGGVDEAGVQKEFVFVPWYQGFYGDIVPMSSLEKLLRDRHVVRVHHPNPSTENATPNASGSASSSSSTSPPSSTDDKKSKRMSKSTFVCVGKAHADASDPCRIEISCLPLGRANETYKEYLKQWKRDGWLSADHDICEYVTDYSVKYVIQLPADSIYKGMLEHDPVKFYKDWKLTENISVDNMNVFNSDGKLTHYASIEPMIDDFMRVRKVYYERRKAYQLAELQTIIRRFSNQYRFLQAIKDGTVEVHRKSIGDIVAQLVKHGFDRFDMKKQDTDATTDAMDISDTVSDSSAASSSRSESNGNPSGNVVRDVDMEEEVESTTDDGYRYLLDMSIRSFGQEKLDRLKRQLDAKQLQHDTLQRQTVYEIWTREIDEFTSAYETWLRVKDKERMDIIGGINARSSRQPLFSQGVGLGWADPMAAPASTGTVRSTGPSRKRKRDKFANL